MKEFTALSNWRGERLRLEGRTIGFVPTMGALHAGHTSLLERARAENDIVVLSIYVNPTQFNNPDDLNRYPITVEADRAVAAQAGVDCLVMPRYEEIYPDGYRYKLTENSFSHLLCGAHRPGHFDGVLTVVMKLFNLVRPTRAYFGEKDFQQLQLIRGMVEAFFLPLDIVPCATVREVDGLAMSSRNVNLSAQAREMAPLLPRLLQDSVSAAVARERLIQAGFDVDYVEDIVDSSKQTTRRFAAAVLGGVRLIDNCEVTYVAR